MIELKRAMDIVVSGAALVLLSPLMLAAALAVWVTMGSPVLFRQQRPGLGGELFELTKFRTMRDGDGGDGDRLTSLGKLLRSTSVDELPELVNILRGEMSLVGPRPLLPEYLPLYSERQATRHDVRPGLTGLAQISGRNNTRWEERLELDAQYVETHSVLGDLRILVATVKAVVRRDGIAADGQATMRAFTGTEERTGS